jgi:hypothetical protein
MALDPDDDNDVPMNQVVNALVAALKLVRHVRLKSTDSRGQRATKQSFYGLLVLTSAAAIAIVVQEIGGEGS